MTAESVVNNKVHSAIRVSPFMANYMRELQIEADIKRKSKVKKAMEFVERMRRVQEEVRTALRKVQEKMRRLADREK